MGSGTEGGDHEGTGELGGVSGDDTGDHRGRSRKYRDTGNVSWKLGTHHGVLLPYASSIAVGSGTDFYWKKDMDGRYKPAYFVDDLTSAFQLGRDMYTSGVIVKDLLLETTNTAREKFCGESVRRSSIREALAAPMREWGNTGRDFMMIRSARM